MTHPSPSTVLAVGPVSDLALQGPGPSPLVSQSGSRIDDRLRPEPARGAVCDALLASGADEVVAVATVRP